MTESVPSATRSEEPRMKKRYKEQAIAHLTERFSYGNVMRVPRLVKCVVSMGVGAAIQDAKILDGAINDMSTITGQKPAVRRATKSISNFKLREGMAVGCMVTLRGNGMYEFLDKLFNLTLPRVRDFGGISPDSFDGRGNFAMGLKEQLVFPEIDYDKIDRIRGMNIVVVTTARTDEEGRALLTALGCPFRQA
ncbi:MAG: 50S ribosomal protein L5 [Armatimonadetes bacterium]|nr:50S ribosomal protein L5 [Armatimonadota bacterium]